MVFRRRTNLRVRPRKKDSPKYISLIAFSQTYTHSHSDWHTHTSSCNHSLVSHQLNFLSQIIFHFPEAAQNQGRNFSQTPFEKKTEKTSSGLGSKKIAPTPVRRHEKPGPSVSTLKFIIYNFLQSSFVRVPICRSLFSGGAPSALCRGGFVSHRN